MRLFFAIQLPDETREKIRPALDAARAVAGESVGFTRIEQVHFTLAFLGETSKLDDAVAAAQAVQSLAPFEVGIGGRGAFPGLGRPRVLWLGVTEGSQQLTAVAETLAAGLRERGFKLEDRPFRAPLTLARAKPRGDRDARRALESIPPGELARFQATQLVLMQSTLGPSGAKHETRDTILFSGPK